MYSKTLKLFYVFDLANVNMLSVWIDNVQLLIMPEDGRCLWYIIMYYYLILTAPLILKIKVS